MKIVILDGYTLNPGDISWAPLEAVGSITVHDRTAIDEVVTRVGDADMILTNKAVVNADHIAAFPNVKYIGVLATGYNVVDLNAAKAKGITVTNIPGYSGKSVPQLTFSLLLALTSSAAALSTHVHQGRWTNCADFCFWDTPLIELDQLTLGVVGYGNIAKGVIDIARSFGMQIMVSTRTVPTPTPEDITFVDVDTLFAQADVISLNCPLTDATQRMVNAERLTTMKSSAYILNTGRGPLIDEAALAEALNSGKIAGAGLDVLSSEPPATDNPLLGAKNCIITPHVAWATVAARKRLMHIAADNIKAFSDGSAVNVVN